MTESKRIYQEKYSKGEKHRASQKIVNRRHYDKRVRTPEGKAYLLWNAAKQRAAKKNLPFTISFEYFKEKMVSTEHCEITGDKFDYRFRTDGRINPYLPSLDQKIPGNGYTPENIQIVTTWYNRFKGNLLDLEAIEILKKKRNLK